MSCERDRDARCLDEKIRGSKSSDGSRKGLDSEYSLVSSESRISRSIMTNRVGHTLKRGPKLL